MTSKLVQELITNEDFKTFFKSSWAERDKEMQANMKLMMDECLNKQIKEMEVRQMKYMEEMKEKHATQLENMEKKFQEMTLTNNKQACQMKREISDIEEKHTRRIEQVEGEIHELSCTNTKLQRESSDQQEQLTYLLSNIEEKSRELKKRKRTLMK